MSEPRTMISKAIQTTYLVVHGPVAPRQEEWDAYVEDMEQHIAGISGVFVTAVGGASGPNAAQRRQAAAVWERHGKMPPISVVTASAAQRGIVTAFNWFFPKPIRVFSPEQLREAFEYIATPAMARYAIAAEVAQFAEELGVRFPAFAEADLT